MLAFMLAMSEMSFSFSRARPVLRVLTHAFAPGAVTGILGPNGAGKSTLLRLLLGVIRPTTGRILLNGKDLSCVPARRRAAALGYIPQHSELAFAFTVAQVVGLGRFGVEEVGLADATNAVLDRVGLLDRKSEPFGILSAGQQQRVTLARVLAQLHGRDPHRSVILADEPVSAMDPKHALTALRLLREEAERGATVIVVLHDSHLTSAFTQHTLLLGSDGTIAAAGPTGDIVTPANLGAVFGVGFSQFADPSGRRSVLVNA